MTVEPSSRHSSFFPSVINQKTHSAPQRCVTMTANCVLMNTLRPLQAKLPMSFGAQYSSLGKEKDDPPRFIPKSRNHGIAHAHTVTAQNHIFSDAVF